MRLQIMEVDVDDIQVGDLVLNDEETHANLIMDKRQTRLHAHKFYKRFIVSTDKDNNGVVSLIYRHQIKDGKRTICRLVE